MIISHISRIFLLVTVVFVGTTASAGSLQDAIEAGDLERVRIEIAQGADVNKADLMLGLPLMIAAQGNHITIAEALVKSGADINGWDISGTALHSAARSGHAAMVEFLIGNGAEVNATPDGITTPLHQAAANGHIDTVELLIKNGASVNSRPGCSSALHLSAAAG